MDHDGCSAGGAPNSNLGLQRHVCFPAMSQRPSINAHQIVRADNVITLATKVEKDSPAMKRAKCTKNRPPPPPSASCNTSATQFYTTIVPTPIPLDFLKIAQRAQVHESQLVKLAKAIPSMIQLSIKKAMQPAKDKLKSLCSTVEVLDSEVITLRKEVSALGEPPCTSNPNTPEPAAVSVQPKAPRSPPDDWWVEYDSTLEIVSDEELYHSRPTPPPMLSVYDVDPS
ncbi:hypothetical protein HAX54_031431 [Datura stramonium]|uniref:Polyprotein protein n=1 Tax=Datura stramonium TaxID=4076 RepID=A0ABS8V9A5_DATST|nr:hypothetical protein [Datura stramonium]